MEIPNNCRECECDNTCTGAHYGSLGCKYKDEIVERILNDERRADNESD